MNEHAAGERLRLFAAVEVPEDVRAQVQRAARPLRERAPDLKWTRPEGWHLTLAFLGWVDRARVDDVQEALAQAAARCSPFTLALTGAAGTFRSGALWAGVHEAPALEALADATRAALIGQGFDIEERAFRPHLTLARARRGQRLPRDLVEEYDGPAASWDVERLVLMRSHLRQSGAVYEEWAAWRLAAG